MRLPKVAALFHSSAPYTAADAVGAAMTGMGGDGADELFELKAAGPIVPNGETSVAFRMLKAAVALAPVMRAAPFSPSPVEIPHARTQT